MDEVLSNRLFPSERCSYRGCHYRDSASVRLLQRLRLLTWGRQTDALIEPDRGRPSNSGRIVAYPDRTVFCGDYFRIGGDTPTIAQNICHRFSTSGPHHAPLPVT